MIIEVENLTKRYGEVTAVNHISFSVEKGTLLGFLGVNGAGKTTAISMLSTLLRPDEGRAVICGETLGQGDAAIRRRIGMVYQQNCLDDILTVQENLMCRGILHGASRREAALQLKKLSQVLKLGDILKKKYRTLSGGQKRRCEIAAALMHAPEILFLDEPTTGLDPATRADVWKTVRQLREEEGMTVFLTTHYMEEAAEADKSLILDRGRIITEGTPFALKERYVKDKLRLKYLDGSSAEFQLNSTMEALPILEREKARLEGFEVVSGNMDDVFLGAVGRALPAGSGEPADASDGGGQERRAKGSRAKDRRAGKEA